MGVAGLIFEPYPPNFEKLHNFKKMMSKDFFDISTGFRFSKLQFGSAYIPVAVTVLVLEHKDLQQIPKVYPKYIQSIPKEYPKYNFHFGKSNLGA